MSLVKECCISDWVFLLSSYDEAGKSASDLELLARAISARCRKYEMLLTDEEVKLVNRFVPKNEKISKDN